MTFDNVIIIVYLCNFSALQICRVSDFFNRPQIHISEIIILYFTFFKMTSRNNPREYISLVQDDMLVKILLLLFQSEDTSGSTQSFGVG